MNSKNDMVMTKEKWEEIRGPLLTRDEVIERLKEYPDVYRDFLRLKEEYREELVAFSMGVKGAKMTYDSFFKHVLDPELFRENVEDFLSACFREKVEIVDVLPNESKHFTEDSALIITDMLVRLKSGDIVNVEIQRIGYMFPGERCACYSSDVVVRQLTYLKAKRKREKKHFLYRDVKKVYSIVLMYKSAKMFHELEDVYLHYSKQTFESGLNLDLLQEYLLVPLDIFLDCPHNEISRLDAWLYFIASDDMDDIERVCSIYPEFCERYREVFRFRFQPKELVSMYWSEIRDADREHVLGMIELMKQELVIGQKKLEDNKKELEDNKKELEDNRKELEDNRKELEEKNKEAERLRIRIMELEQSQKK